MIRGAQAVPGGEDRLDYFGESDVPVVIGDGVDNLGPQPVTESDLNAHYASRRNIPSPLTMSVVNTGGNNYTVHVYAEENVSGTFMAVAYANIDYEGDPYPVFVTQILTNVYGDSFNIGAGESREIPLSVSGSIDGVVAWINAGSKGARGFRPHECLQAADSNAQNTEPTPTPPAEPTATPPGEPTATPSGPTPTPNGEAFHQSLDLSSDLFRPNDHFVLDIKSANPTGVTYNVMQYLALEISGYFYFWPGWTDVLDYNERTYPPGFDDAENILDFYWPSGVGSYSGIHFWLAAIDETTNDLACDYSMIEWGYTE